MTDPIGSPGIGQRTSLLSGVRVVDLTRFLAGPFGSMILGDIGADVIKVEMLTGDTTRVIPPHSFQGDSAYFLSINRNKKSVAVDLKTKAGREVVQRLIASADIVLDNLRLAQRRELGLEYSQLKSVKPDIISCSLTAFGSEGPYEDRPGYDMVVQALSGVMSLTGEEGGKSVRAGVPIGDVVAGLYLVIGALGALEHRRATGEGQHIDVGMLDCQVSLLTYLASYYFVGGVVAGHQGRGHLSLATYNTFETSDGAEIVVCANTQAMWESLCGVLGRKELIDDPDYRTTVDRLNHKSALLAILGAEFAKWSIADIYPALVAAEVPAAPIQAIDQVLSDEQVLLRNMVVDVPHRKGGSYRAVGSPIKSSIATTGPFLSPPGIGEHTEHVLQDIGFSADEIAELVRTVAIGPS